MPEVAVSAIALLLCGLLIGGLVGVTLALLRSRQTSVAERVRLAQAETELRLSQEQRAHCGQQLAQANADNASLQAEVARLQQARNTDADKLQWVQQAEAKMRDAFAALAGQSLQSNSSAFMERAREQVQALLTQVHSDWGRQKAEMQNLVDPLQTNLSTLDQRVREMEQKREGAYQRVDEQLRQLMDANASLQRSTVTLAQALKSSSVRGRWGELQLRRIAELSGMDRHISFVEQASVEDGRPDMVVSLPNGGSIPIDSKTPMSAFLEAMEASDDNTRQACMSKHCRAVRGRVQELGDKKYWEKVGPAVDFVVMFMPSEACLSAAFNADPQLLEDALSRKVMVVTPITLLALLKTVAYGWQQHHINEDARLIAEEGREFYKRLQTFIGYMAEMRAPLNRSVEVYNKAVGSLENRLLPSVRRLEAMAGSGSGTPLDAPDCIDVAARELTLDH